MNSLTYTHKCEVCNAANHEVIKPMLSEHEQEDLLYKIYIGEYKLEHLPTSIYLKTAYLLQDDLYTGFGTNNDEKQQETLLAMRRNVYYFSAAKTYQLVKVIKENGKDSPTLKAFKENTKSILNDFVGAYFAAEKDHTYQTGKQARRWTVYDKRKTLPYLEYVTKKDNRVRPAHIVLDGIIRQTEDKFWDTFSPPNGWLCRCKTKVYKDGENTELKDFDMEEALKNTPPMFRYNFGKDKIVFPKEHPYFKTDNTDLARNNFNLPLPHEG